ncbi:MAG: N-acetylglucosamine-6-phosphate deacetylase [Chloroflexi bacterium]|nr:N-acetylglucosamine-6-phosphate deacetylase [Chloroflexota bacterium]
MPGRLLVSNAILALPGGLSRGDLLCEGPRIVAIGRKVESAGAAVFDAQGLTAGPGFIDVHVHGGGGHSFFRRDPDRIRAYSAWAPQNGLTSYLISTIGRDEDETAAIFESLAPTVAATPGAEPVGFHLEGPFINPLRKGAFDPAMLRAPRPWEFDRYQAAARGLIRQVTFAPELPDALELAAAIAASGALPAMGHTDATAEECRAGFEGGVKHVTHLFNAMRPIHQREGGPIVAALLEESVTCELICDGAHIAPEPLRLAYRVLGPHRAVVVTDNLHIAGTGSEGGQFAGQEVKVTGAKAERADGTIVGSVAPIDQHFRNVVEFLGLDLPTAFRLCATNPARVAGVQRSKGCLERGYDADVVFLDSDLAVAATLCRGEVAFNRDEWRLHPA